jgi:hypothetical protein
MGTPVKGRWVAREHCVQCDTILNIDEQCCSNGVCPYCGYVSSFTLCETKLKPVFIKEKSFLERFQDFIGWIR